MQINEIKGNNIAILGFSREGKSVLNFLRTYVPHAQITILDKEPITDTSEDVQKITGNAYLGNLSQFDTIVRSPGISKRTPELTAYIDKGGHITSSTNIFLEQFRQQTIGITGTKGKSTTTTLIYNMLKKSRSDIKLVGNIGNAVLDTISDATPNTIFVMELSSYQLDDARYSPHTAVLLQIGQDHITYHGSIENYIQAKNNITKFQSENDILILNPTHEVTNRIAHNSQAQKIYYGAENSVFTYTENELVYLKNPIIQFKNTKLLGNGSHENATAAATTAKKYNATNADIHEALHEFKPLEHRLEYVATIHGITFYNDSIATTPEATINALDALKNTVQTLILGGLDRELDYSILEAYLVTSSTVNNLILFPETGVRIERELKEKYPQYSSTITMYHVHSMSEAVSYAYQTTQTEKTVLLSPAASSYNMFINFEDRGNQFKKEIFNIK